MIGGVGLIIMGKITEACARSESVTVMVEPAIRSPIPVTYKLMVDPFGAGFLEELMETPPVASLLSTAACPSPRPPKVKIPGTSGTYVTGNQSVKGGFALLPVSTT